MKPLFYIALLTVGILFCAYACAPETCKVFSVPLETEDVYGLSLSHRIHLVRLAFYLEATDYVWWRESRCGMAANYHPHEIGPNGEEGEYQVRPIFRRDCKHLFGEDVDPYHTDKVRYLVFCWLSYYSPQVGANTIDETYELYRRGPTGYREWKGAQR